MGLAVGGALARKMSSWANDFSWEKVLGGPDTGGDMMYLELVTSSGRTRINEEQEYAIVLWPFESVLKPWFLAWRKDGTTYTQKEPGQVISPSNQNRAAESVMKTFTSSCGFVGFQIRGDAPAANARLNFTCLIGEIGLNGYFLADIVSWPEGFGPMYVRQLEGNTLLAASPFGVFQTVGKQVTRVAPGAEKNRVSDEFDQALWERLKQEYNARWGSLF